MDELIERLRDGCVLAPGCWTIDEGATDALMAEAAAALEEAREDAERYRWLRLRLAGAEHVDELVEFNTDMHPELPGAVDAAIDQARGKGVADA